MRYREYRAHPRLASLVRCYWTLVGTADEATGGCESVLPDGCMDLILHRGSRFRRRREDGELQLQQRSLLAGQITRPLPLQASGAVEVLGVRFRPAGASAFFPMPLHEWVDEVRSLDEVWGAGARHLEEVVREAADLTYSLRQVEAELLRRLPENGPGQRLSLAIQAAETSGGQINVDQLARLCSLGRRQLERVFRRSVGLTPKQLCRIVRFQSVLKLVENPGPVNWVSVALRAGYCDQAHLIRDFQQFAGTTPAAFAGQDHALGAQLAAGTPHHPL